MALLRPTRFLISEKSGTYTIKWSYTIIWQIRVGKECLGRKTNPRIDRICLDISRFVARILKLKRNTNGQKLKEMPAENAVNFYRFTDYFYRKRRHLFIFGRLYFVWALGWSE